MDISIIWRILFLVALSFGLSEIEFLALQYSKLNIKERKQVYKIKGNAVPNHQFGPFIDTANEMKLSLTSRRFKIPKVPVPNEVPKCLNTGPIGVAVNGIPFYHPYSKRGLDAGSHIAGDRCGGHLDHKGRYHYHTIPLCLYNPNATDQLLGIAMDGYPIYGPIDDNGEQITAEDLDLCHGRLENGFYVYRMTFDFPYILGCYHGRTLTKTSGHCMVALHRNPALEGIWKKRPKSEDEESRKLPKLIEDKHAEKAVDINSKRYKRMRNKIIALLVKRNKDIN